MDPRTLIDSKQLIPILFGLILHLGPEWLLKRKITLSEFYLCGSSLMSTVLSLQDKGDISQPLWQINCVRQSKSEKQSKLYLKTVPI